MESDSCSRNERDSAPIRSGVLIAGPKDGLCGRACLKRMFDGVNWSEVKFEAPRGGSVAKSGS